MAPAAVPPTPADMVPGVERSPPALNVAVELGVWMACAPPPVTRAELIRVPAPTTVTVPLPLEHAAEVPSTCTQLEPVPVTASAFPAPSPLNAEVVLGIVPPPLPVAGTHVFPSHFANCPVVAPLCVI